MPSIRHGFAPEVPVFGKGFRQPGSSTGDDQLSSHLTAYEETCHGLKFRQQLAYRETAQLAFVKADNSMAIRRAALQRSRPPRGQYLPGEWVMVWRSNANAKGWIGPAKVIQQDNSNTVFCQHMGNLLRAAPEHVQFPPVNNNNQSETTSSINTEIPRASNNPQAVSDHVWLRYHKISLIKS